MKAPRVYLLLVVAVLALAFLFRKPPHSWRGSSEPARHDETSPIFSASPALPAVPITDPVDAIAAPGVAFDAARLRADAIARTSEFTDWLTAWRRADENAQPALAAVGVGRARARRSALKHLIETDPRLALELTVPVGLRSELPADVRAELERRIDARGDLEVQISCGDHGTRIDRAVVINGERYAAYTFGRRELQTTKFDLPLHGIAVDRSIALETTPFRELDPMEKVSRGFGVEHVVVLVGSDLVTAASPAELQTVIDRLVAAESVPGPHVALQSNSGLEPSTGTPATAALTSPPDWILGAKRVLWVKVDFSDAPGAVATDTEIAATNTAVSEFYRSASHGRTTISFNILPAVLRLPREKAYYNTFSTSDDEVAASAKTLAKQYDAANGNTGAFDPDRYDRWIVVFSKIAIHTFAGRAQIGGPQLKMHGTIAAGTVVHELGHAQSLNHSHYWLPSSASAVGPGAHVEYGDIFDAMGSSSSSANNFFNVAQKAKLGYLDGADINSISQSGTYRLGRHDHRDSAGVRAFKVAPANTEYEFWFEHRQSGPTAFNAAQLDRLRNGVMLHWGPEKSPRTTTGQGSYLVDATPGSAGGAGDAALRIGETFVDPNAGITIKPLASGGTAPNEYVDVQVSFGAVDGNRTPY